MMVVDEISRDLNELALSFSNVLENSKIKNNSLFPNIVSKKKIYKLFDELNSCTELSDLVQKKNELIYIFKDLKEILSSPVDINLISKKYNNESFYHKIHFLSSECDVLISIVEEYYELRLKKIPVKKRNVEIKKEGETLEKNISNKKNSSHVNLDYYYIPSKNGKLIELCTALFNDILNQQKFKILSNYPKGKREVSLDFEDFLKHDLKASFGENLFLQKLSEFFEKYVSSSSFNNYVMSTEIFERLNKASFLSRSMKRELASLNDSASNMALNNLIRIILRYKKEILEELVHRFENISKKEQQKLVDETVVKDEQKKVDDSIISSREEENKKQEFVDDNVIKDTKRREDDSVISSIKEVEKKQDSVSLYDDRKEALVTEETYEQKVEKIIENPIITDSQIQSRDEIISYLPEEKKDPVVENGISNTNKEQLKSIAITARDRILDRYRQDNDINNTILLDYEKRVHDLEDEYVELDTMLKELWNQSVHIENGENDYSKELEDIKDKLKKCKLKLLDAKKRYDTYRLFLDDSLEDNKDFDNVTHINILFDDLLRAIDDEEILSVVELENEINNIQVRLNSSSKLK